MRLPIHKIIWAKTDRAHHDHLHVEGIPHRSGTPPLSNPGMTPSIKVIYDALTARFGQPAYMSGGDWNHMGWFNRRRIAGTQTWSQHAWSNALDIGPYYGVAQQQRFYDFLTDPQPPPEDPTMKPPDWARTATQWHIDRGIYTEKAVDDVDEELEFHRQTVFRHRFYNAIRGEFGSGGGQTIDLRLQGRLLGQ